MRQWVYWDKEITNEHETTQEIEQEEAFNGRRKETES